jgi:hypothetical protein
MTSRPEYASEYVRLSPAEKAARVRRAARAMQNGVELSDIRDRGFTEGEVVAARQMLKALKASRQ